MSAYKIKLNFRNLKIRRIYVINEVSKRKNSMSEHSEFPAIKQLEF